MKRWRSHPKTRWLAKTLSFLMLVPYLALGPAPAARAQQQNPEVYVLDFNNKTTVGGALLGRVAAAQMSLQLSESLNWNVIPDAQVQRRIQELNMRPPFDRIDRVRIANGIDATAVVYGNITDAAIDQQRGVAEARIEVMVEDIQTGTLINGAVAEGRSTPRMGFTGDADILLEEALGKAAFRAREFMDTFRLPEGTVLNTTVTNPETGEADALINIGARQGVRRGMEMIATRQRAVVGRVRVSNVDADISTVRVLDSGQGVRPEDRVRAVFNFADFPITRGRLRSMTPSAQVKLASAALPGKRTTDVEPRVTRADRNDEFTPFQARPDVIITQPTVTPPPPVVVDEPEVGGRSDPGTERRRSLGRNALRLLVGGALVLGILALGGRGGRNATRPDSATASAWQLRIGQPGANIRLTWDRPKAINSSNVVQYVVYRSDTLGQFVVEAAYDSDARRAHIDTEAAITYNNVFDGQPGTDDAGAQVTVTSPGVVPGLQYRYQVATVFRLGLSNGPGGDPGTGGGGGGGGGGTGGGTGQPNQDLAISPLSESSPWITAISPPLIVDPLQGEQVTLSELTVEWQKVPGADTYFIWVSSDVNFPKNRRVEFGPFQALPPEIDFIATASQTIDARSNRLRGGNRVFVTVGARASRDATVPEPFGAIFGPAVQVQALTEPPPPPGGGGNGGGGNGPPDPPTATGAGKKKNRSGGGENAAPARGAGRRR